MDLVQGTRLGPYEITGQIGVGGMGEVYRARDARLARDVALKVLPDRFAADPERLARFQREAQILRRSIIRISRAFTASRNRTLR
jgi:serine/threonine protein kinase